MAHPNTFVAVHRADALTSLVPLALLAVPLRHVGWPVAHGHATAVPTTGSYGDVPRDRVFRRLLLLSFVSSCVGYGQVEGGWTAYPKAIARVSTRALGIAFAVNTTTIVLLQVVVLRLPAGVAFQLAHITGPTVAGFLLGANRGYLFITMLVGQRLRKG